MIEQSEVADSPRRRKRLRRSLLLLATAIVIYVVLMFPVGCGKSLANRFLLFPSTEPIATYGTTQRFIETPSGKVQVFIAQGPGTSAKPPVRFVLHLMGNGSRAEHEVNRAALRWDEAPTEVWAVNYPGYGASDGPATLDKLVHAAEAVLDELADRAGDRPIFLDSDSLGTTIALHLVASGSHAIAGIVMKNPPPLRQLIMGRFGWWNLWLVAGPIASAIPSELDSIHNAKRCDIPAIFILAERDSLVVPGYQTRVVDAYAGPKRSVVLKGADHNTVIVDEDEQSIRSAVGEFIPPSPTTATAPRGSR